jgi:hypothetical protein
VACEAALAVHCACYTVLGMMLLLTFQARASCQLLRLPDMPHALNCRPSLRTMTLPTTPTKLRGRMWQPPEADIRFHRTCD